MQVEVIIAILILFLLVFLATIDMSFTQLSDVSLRRLLAELKSKEDSNPSIREILENRPRFRFTLSACIQILLIIFAVLVTMIVHQSQLYQTPQQMLLIALAIALPLSGIFRQFIPRLLAWRNPEKKLLLLLPFVRPLYSFMSFLADPFEKFLHRHQKSDETEDSEDDEHIQALIEVGQAEGIIEEQEKEMIETMIDFLDRRVSEIMTPRTEICALPIETTVRQARDLIIEEKYSRIPVYRENIDNIEGVIYVRDLLTAWAENKEDEKIENFLRPAFFVPETKIIPELLKDMQANHFQLAIVIDEYGGVAGLVTLEDIVEEIVGEIEDEDIEDEEIIEIIEGEEGYFDVLGSTEISKIERLFDLYFEDEEVTTIGGLVVNELGYVPKPREKFNIHGLNIEILRSDDKKIHLLRLRKASEDTIPNIESQN
jgi:CBS domain containing-hemolysin-like protein